ncbi:MFS transporter [Lactobacillus terrae]|uniref:MFS transporter n=1 Tax=Lactobacillus terrae TaxID=2269374 RepID=UPI000C1B6EFF|nr:MFS transporter [Lactobacillus terrae]
MKSQRMWLLTLNVVFNLVMGFILPVNTIFINKNLHQPLTVAGFALMIYSLLMMLGNALGGILFDKFSRRKTLYIGYFISVISLLIMSFHHVWPTYVILLVTLGFGMGIAYTAISGYTAFVAEQSVGDSRIIFNNMYLASNIGIAVGSTAVGIIFNNSIFLTFFIPVLFFLICIVILFLKSDVLDSVNEDATKSNKPYKDSNQVNPRDIIGNNRFILNMVIICFAIFAVWMGYSQWDSNMSIYMLNKGFSTRQYGFIFTVNAGSLLIIQPIVNRVISKIIKYLKVQIFVGTVIMGLSFLLLPGANNYSLFIISMLILTVGESLVFPTIPALLSKMSTDKNRGTYQSFYTIFGSLGRALGPYVGSVVVTVMSFANMFFGITIIMILMAVLMLLVKETD